VAHACNPSYSEGKDQEACGSKPAQANTSQDPISKKTHHKKGLVEVGPEFNPNNAKKKKKPQKIRK
jgi:hypothetical protein